MKPDPLIEAILAPGEQGLALGLRAARRRRIQRRIARVSVGLAVIASAAWGLWPRNLPPEPAFSEGVAQAVPAGSPARSSMVESRPGSVEIITTADALRSGRGVQRITDDELLAHFPAGRAILVGTGGDRRLVRMD